MSDKTVTLDLPIGSTPGPLGVVRLAVQTVKQYPSVLAPYLLLAILAAVVPLLANLLSPVAFALGLLFAYDAIGGVDRNDGFVISLVKSIVVGFLGGIIVLFGAIFFIAPGLVFLAALQFAIPAVFLSGAGIEEAIRQSFRMTTDEPWTSFGVFGIFLLAAGVVFGATFVGITEAFSLTGDVPIVAVRGASSVVTATVSPVYVAALAIMYGCFHDSHELPDEA